MIRRATLFVLAALFVGWGGHRVFQRLATLPLRRVPANREALAPVPGGEHRSFVWIPPSAVCPGIWLGKAEVTCEAFAEFLNNTRNDIFASPQFVREGGRWQSVRPAHAVTFVALAQAQAFAQWYSVRRGCRARLPTADEWELAARGGIADAPYAWGWGAPAERADFAKGSPSRTALYAANGFGLFDMSGGVAEWCTPQAGDTAPALGGSWSDRDPAALQPGHRTRFPVTYRDADVGFRILVEPVSPPATRTTF